VRLMAADRLREFKSHLSVPRLPAINDLITAWHTFVINLLAIITPSAFISAGTNEAGKVGQGRVCNFHAIAMIRDVSGAGRHEPKDYSIDRSDPDFRGACSSPACGMLKHSERASRRERAIFPLASLRRYRGGLARDAYRCGLNFDRTRSTMRARTDTHTRTRAAAQLRSRNPRRRVEYLADERGGSFIL